MTEEEPKHETVSLLQDLGLKEYEARCFLALTQLSTGTAKDISEISEVPRTRVYDAIRVLEAKGLVEIHHSSPQQFRAVGTEEAATTLRQKYDTRIDSLKSQLEHLDHPGESADDQRMQEVWSLTGAEGIQSRTMDLFDAAEAEIVLLIVEEELLTESLFDHLDEAVERGVRVVIGGKTTAIIDRIKSELPSVEVFETDLSWLVGPEHEDEVAISRLLLIDRTALLVSSFYPGSGPNEQHEQAVFATGLGNGIVVLIRRLISSGFLYSAKQDR